jgi:response regulator NasT
VRRPSPALTAEAAFEALVAPTVILDDDYVIRAANPAYLRATERTADELLSVNLFEAFPDNPEVAGAPALAASFQRVLRHQRPEHLVVQRYDLVEQGDPPRYRTKHWAPACTPVHDDGRVVGILMRVDDVTELSPSALRSLEQRRDLVQRRRAAAELDDEERARAMLIAVDDYNAMAEEIVQLREALSSRSTIDQAKGLVMAERRCTPDEAFRHLTKLSNDTNVRVADVAAALVYRAQGGASGNRPGTPR